MLDKKAKEVKKQNWMEKNVRRNTENEMSSNEKTWSKKNGSEETGRPKIQV